MGIREHRKNVTRFHNQRLVVGVLTATLLAASSAASPLHPAAASFDVVEASITEMQAAMERGEVTSVDLVDAYLARIAAYDHEGPRLESVLRINPRARDTAAALDDERRASGPRGALHGIPVILKDNYDTGDMPTTGGSLALAGYVPAHDGFQVHKLRRAGAVIIAKANMHELAMGITTISSLGDQTLNPYDLSRNPGGSSGGTGAAIAASFAAVGMGSDTCGSIRIPSSQNNLVGLRPTKGLSSISGIIPLSHTQDVGGPLARNVTDLAIVLDATIGRDPDDPATAFLDDYELSSFTDSLAAHPLAGARFGKLEAFFDAEAAVTPVIDAALEHFADQGAEIIEVEIPGLQDLLAKSGVINFEFKWDFIDYLANNPDAPMASIAEILELGTHHEALRTRYERRNRIETRDSAAYLAALEWRTILRAAVVQVLDENDLDGLLYPTMNRRPARIGEPQTGSTCSLAPNSGLPAISIPAGFTADLLPIGIELLGRPLSDTRLVSYAYAFEQTTDHRRAPDVTPALIDGAAPAPIGFEAVVRAAAGDSSAVARADFTFDPVRNTLAYALTIETSAKDAFAATLHLGKDGNGAAVARLSRLGVPATEGVVVLTPVQRRALTGGDLWLRLFTRAHPAGAPRAQLNLPNFAAARRD